MTLQCVYEGIELEKKAKKRMVAIIGINSPTHPIKTGLSWVINNTLTEPIKPKIIILAVVASR